MGLDWTKLPDKRDPFYQHTSLSPAKYNAQQPSDHAAKPRKISQTTSKQAFFEHHLEHLKDEYWSGPDSYQSSTSTQRAADAARDADREEEQDLSHETNGKNSGAFRPRISIEQRRMLRQHGF